MFANTAELLFTRRRRGEGIASRLTLTLSVMSSSPADWGTRGEPPLVLRHALSAAIGLPDLERTKNSVQIALYHKGYKVSGSLRALVGPKCRWRSGKDLHVCAWDGDEPVRIEIAFDEWTVLRDHFAANEEAAVAALASLAARAEKIGTAGMRGYSVRATLALPIEQVP